VKSAIMWAALILAEASLARADCEAIGCGFTARTSNRCFTWRTRSPSAIRATAADLGACHLRLARPLRRGGTTSAISWVPLARLAHVSLVGTIAGKRIYMAQYSRLSLALLAEQDDWSFCPVLLLDADPGWDPAEVVASLGQPEIFEVDGRDLLSLRVYYKGMGTLQDSLFFGMADGHLVHLEPEPFGELLSRTAGKSARMVGLLPTLSRLGGATYAGGAVQGTVRVQYRVSGVSSSWNR